MNEQSGIKWYGLNAKQLIAIIMIRSVSTKHIRFL